MPQATALSPGSLLGQGVITTAATPSWGTATSTTPPPGPLSPTLRQASLGTLGTTCLVEKDPNDTSNNAVTVTCYPGETFLDGSTTRTLTNPGDFLMLALLATGWCRAVESCWQRQQRPHPRRRQPSPSTAAAQTPTATTPHCSTAAPQAPLRRLYSLSTAAPQGPSQGKGSMSLRMAPCIISAPHRHVIAPA
jgi:hypothetical protein